MHMSNYKEQLDTYIPSQGPSYLSPYSAGCYDYNLRKPPWSYLESQSVLNNIS